MIKKSPRELHNGIAPSSECVYSCCPCCCSDTPRTFAGKHLSKFWGAVFVLYHRSFTMWKKPSIQQGKHYQPGSQRDLLLPARGIICPQIQRRMERHSILLQISACNYLWSKPSLYSCSHLQHLNE